MNTGLRVVRQSALRSPILGCVNRPLAFSAFAIARRGYADQPDAKTKAATIIDALPGNNALSKSGILITGGLGATYLISSGLYVVNAETLLTAAFLGFVYLMSKTLAPAYKDWADGHINRIKKILYTARDGQLQAVKDRIDSVSQLNNVVGITKDLFALSKETVELEAKAFEQQQKVNFATEAKSVLDSWVRFESQARQRQQKELAENIIAKIQKEIKNPKFQQDVLQQAVNDVEKLLKA